MKNFRHHFCKMFSKYFSIVLTCSMKPVMLKPLLFLTFCMWTICFLLSELTELCLQKCKISQCCMCWCGCIFIHCAGLKAFLNINLVFPLSSVFFTFLAPVSQSVRLALKAALEKEAWIWNQTLWWFKSTTPIAESWSNLLFPNRRVRIETEREHIYSPLYWKETIYVFAYS